MTINVIENSNENKQVFWQIHVFENADDFEMENNVLTVWDSRGRKHQFTNCVYSVDYESEGNT